MVSDHSESMDPREYIADPHKGNPPKSYEYYRILQPPGQPDTPVRVHLDELGRELDADTINADKQSLTRGTHLVTEATEGPYGNDSDEEEFWRLCAEHVEYDKKLATDHSESMDPREYIEDPNKDNPPASYEYYRILQPPNQLDTPVRVYLDEGGAWLGADTINGASKSLVNGIGLMTEAMEGPYGYYSDEEEFWRLCAEHVEYAKKLATDHESIKNDAI